MITGNKVILRKKKLSDARNDYKWQTDPVLAQLDAAPLLVTSFAQYIMDYTNELRHLSPSKHRFSIDTIEGEFIGNCSYYSIDKIKGKTELGIMIGNRDYWDKGYGTDAVSTLINYIFCQTNLARIYLKTLSSNNRAQKCFHKCGFRQFRRLTRDNLSFIFMEIHRHQWQEIQTKPISQASHVIDFSTK
jgi:RimJ/RimL family protein N-acetyltransferase